MEFPDEDENRQKDHYISECPFLRRFVDKDGLEGKAWIDKLKSASISSGTPYEIIEVVGTQKIERTIEGALRDSEIQLLFGKNIERDDKRFMLLAVATMGYELADSNGVYLFYGDIYEKLVLGDVLRNTYEGSLLTLDLLQLGASWRQEAKNDVPPEFRNFTFDLD